MFGSEPFSSKLRMSNLKMYKYDWIWKKNRCSNFIQANYQPRKVYEIISVFSNAPASYSHSGKKMQYNPQMWGESNAINKGEQARKSTGNAFKNKYSETYILKSTNLTGKKFPEAIIEFAQDNTKLHPTQKPVALLEYLIRTYTNEGETVLDFTMGSGTTGVACMNTNRKFIGIEFNPEKDKSGNLVEPDKYFKIAVERIKQACQ